jgi:hypothetical protein
MDAMSALSEEISSRFEKNDGIGYDPDLDWEPKIRQLLGIVPEYAQTEFWPLWDGVVGDLRARGLKVGPISFHGWNDGDAGLVRAIWTLTRHLRPNIVVETGVAHGVTSRFILEALELNGAGNLWSIDLPPLNPLTRREIGVAVDRPRLQDRWTYIAGTSRRRLPVLLSQLRRVDMFIHDSMHSGRNAAFELELAWKYLSPGGVIVVDDIDLNSAFRCFIKQHLGHPSFVCTAEPISPDTRRSNQKGLFGLIVKLASKGEQ